MDEKKFLKILSKELHKPVIKNFKRRAVYTHHKNEIWGADLVDMREFEEFNDGYKYLLTIIDLFTRYAWVYPLKSKSADDVLKVFKNLFPYHRPKKLWVDRGGEFYNSKLEAYLEEWKIIMYSTNSNFHNPFIEVFNKSLKRIMWLYFTSNNTRRYIDELENLVNTYQQRKHRIIKMSPYDAFIREKLKPIEHIIDECEGDYPKYNIGDKVRISRWKDLFEKADHNWSLEIFTIYEIRRTNPIMYYIKDYQNEEIEGGFYENELQKTQIGDIYLIEKILRKRKEKLYVKWLGFTDAHNSWINKADLLE